MAKLTRLASTVTARYYPASDLLDAFYLDGRLSGKREARAADITVDKEDRGFFFSVFSHSTVPGRDPAAEQVFEAPLRKLFNEIKTGRKALDDEIGELVNTAVAVTGRMKLQADNTRSPFFAGVLVKDSEAFAITMGKGLAFLYRDDTLFPLTATDLQIEPVNTQRQKVDNFYNYCATKTATALCSNIAQLKMDDCIIICNREVYDALGQQEILRILYDAEDQCDAAGNIITEAAAKLPGVPLQFLISFVETVTAQEKTGLFGLGKKNRQQSYNEADDDAIEIPIAKAGAAGVAGTAAAAAAAAASASASIPAPVPASDTPEPLFFGNDATNPFVQPLAEQPVVPSGPKDPIHFQDDSLEPFGEPVKENESVTDEGGFVKTEFEGDVDGFKSADGEFDPIPYQQDSFSQSGKAAPLYIPEESGQEDEPLAFGDDYAPVQQKPEVSSNAGGTYYIPFESKESAAPATTNIDDIPDMPLYEAPTYSPPTYPTNSYTPKGYDNAGVYARGSYSLDDEDSDIRKDLPPQPNMGNRSYSYTPPQQTVPSYGSVKDQRAAQSAPRAGQPPVQQATRAKANQPQRSSQDMFEQEKGFDYGDTDAAYKRNKFWVAGLIALCVVCVIILVIAFVISGNNKKTPAVTSVPSIIVSLTPTGAVTPADTATPAPGSSVTPAVTPSVTVAPVSAFYFTDKTGFRTWWDLFYYTYGGIKLDSSTDPRIAMINTYNGKPADYVPQPGDVILVPPISYLTGTATASPTPAA